MFGARLELLQCAERVRESVLYIFRIPGFLDGNDLVILNHAFQKKTQKIPLKEKRKREYFARKQL